MIAHEPNPELFVKMYVRKEAVLSAQIEGTQPSMNDLIDHQAGATPREKRDDVQEIQNYIDGVHYGLEKRRTDRIRPGPVDLYCSQ